MRLLGQTFHEDKNNPVIITEHVHSFIGKLIRHIHDKGFHQIRYYGFYANKSKRAANKVKLLTDSVISHLKSKLKWRIMLPDSFKYDVLLCICGAKMKINYNLSYLQNNQRSYISDA